MADELILVVDDTPRNLKLLVDLLTGNGYRVVTAASGADALQQIAAQRPALVLLDVVMPGMNGYEVCRRIRDDPTTRVLPVVMVTALEPSAERVGGLEAGADDFLAKPISQPELLARVRSLLRVKRLYDTVETQAAQLAEWNRTLEARVAAQVAELERLGTLKRFLPPQLVERVIAGGADDPLISHRREITVVSLELRGFPAFAESNAPEEVMAVLQEHHHAIGELVVSHEGTLERFTGEGVTVFFNDPVPQGDAVERAVHMALAARDRSRALAEDWRRRGFDLDLGIGIAQGYATLGAIGFESRSDYAAIGTVTNLAARLGEAAAPGEILLSQRVHAAVEQQVQSASAGALELRGFARPVSVFRVLRPQSPAPVAPVATRGAERLFRREGDYWTIAYGSEAFRLKDAKGLHYIAHLLACPDREVHALALISLVRATGDLPDSAVQLGEIAPPRAEDAAAILDPRAKTAYRDRLEELRADLVEAESFSDIGRTARIRSEMDALSQQLAAAVGMGGRDRRSAGAAERARVNVTRAISDSVKRIAEFSPPLARHLDASIRTGAFCTYRPPERGGSWSL